MKTELTNITVATHLLNQAITQLEKLQKNYNERSLSRNQIQFNDYVQLIHANVRLISHLKNRITEQTTYVNTQNDQILKAKLYKQYIANQGKINLRTNYFNTQMARFNELAKDPYIAAQHNLIENHDSSVPKAITTKRDNKKLIEKVSLDTLNFSKSNQAMSAEDKKNWLTTTINSMEKELLHSEIPKKVRKEHHKLSAIYQREITTNQEQEAERIKQGKQKGREETPVMTSETDVKRSTIRTEPIDAGYSSIVLPQQQTFAPSPIEDSTPAKSVTTETITPSLHNDINAKFKNILNEIFNGNSNYKEIFNNLGLDPKVAESFNMQLAAQITNNKSTITANYKDMGENHKYMGKTLNQIIETSSRTTAIEKLLAILNNFPDAFKQQYPIDSIKQFLLTQIRSNSGLKNSLESSLDSEVDCIFQSEMNLNAKLSRINKQCTQLAEILNISASEMQNNIFQRVEYRDKINTELKKNIDMILNEAKTGESKNPPLYRISSLISSIPKEVISDDNKTFISNTIRNEITSNYNINKNPSLEDLSKLISGPVFQYNKSGLNLPVNPYQDLEGIIAEKVNKEATLHTSKLNGIGNSLNQAKYLIEEENKLLSIFDETDRNENLNKCKAQFPGLVQFFDNNIKNISDNLKNELSALSEKKTLLEKIEFVNNVSTTLNNASLAKLGLTEQLTSIKNSFANDLNKGSDSTILKELTALAKNNDNRLTSIQKFEQLNLIINALQCGNNKYIKSMMKDLGNKLNIKQISTDLLNNDISVTDKLRDLRTLHSLFPDNDDLNKALAKCEVEFSKQLSNICKCHFVEYPFEEHLKSPGYRSSLVKHYNELASAVETDIYQFSSPKDRATAISNWIHIADNCTKNGDFMTAFTISSALTKKSISTLYLSKNELSRADVALLNDIEQLSSPAKDFMNYKREIALYQSKNSTAPLIPYIGIYDKENERSLAISKDQNLWKGEDKTWLNIPYIASNYISPLITYINQAGKVEAPDKKMEDMLKNPAKSDDYYAYKREVYESSRDPNVSAAKEELAEKYKKIMESMEKNNSKASNDKTDRPEVTKTRPESSSPQTASVNPQIATTINQATEDTFTQLCIKNGITTKAINLTNMSDQTKSFISPHLENIEAIVNRDIRWGIRHLPTDTDKSHPDLIADKKLGINACFYFIDKHFQTMRRTLENENPPQTNLINSIKAEQEKYRQLHAAVKLDILRENPVAAVNDKAVATSQESQKNNAEKPSLFSNLKDLFSSTKDRQNNTTPPKKTMDSYHVMGKALANNPPNGTQASVRTTTSINLHSDHKGKGHELKADERQKVTIKPQKTRFQEALENSRKSTSRGRSSQASSVNHIATVAPPEPSSNNRTGPRR